MKIDSLDSKYLAIMILIGGESRRFGLKNIEFEFSGKPLLLYQMETLSKFDNDVFLVAHSPNQVETYYKKFKIDRNKFIIDDKEIIPYDKIRTPMIGVYSGLKSLNEMGFDKAFVLSCDMPLIKPNVIKYMIEQSESHDCVVPRWKNGYLETLFTIYPVKKSYEKVKQLLEQEIFYLNELIDDQWDINFISVEDSIKPLDANLTSLISINGPIDLEKLIKLFLIP